MGPYHGFLWETNRNPTWVPLWDGPCRTHHSFALWGQCDSFPWNTHCVLAHREPPWVPLWDNPCRVHSSFTSSGSMRVFYGKPIVGLPTECPYSAQCGIAHAGPKEVLHILAPIRVFCGQPNVGLSSFALWPHHEGFQWDVYCELAYRMPTQAPSVV